MVKKIYNERIQAATQAGKSNRKKHERRQGSRMSGIEVEKEFLK